MCAGNNVTYFFMLSDVAGNNVTSFFMLSNVAGKNVTYFFRLSDGAGNSITYLLFHVKWCCLQQCNLLTYFFMLSARLLSPILMT